MELKPLGRRLAAQWFVLCCVILPVGLAVSVGYPLYELANAPVSAPRPHSYKVALSNVLDLQKLALSEAERGEKAFFISHIGCAAPAVWEDPRVIENIKRMREQGVDVKLIGGKAGSGGQKHTMDWTQQFANNLADTGVEGDVYVIRDQELPCHSAVAGSEDRPRAYITLPRDDPKDDTYPTQYIVANDAGLCLAWREYLLNAFEPGKHGG